VRGQPDRVTASEPESRAEAAEEQPTRRIKQAVSKRPYAPTSQGEPNPKKTKKESEAEASARMPEVIPPDAEGQEEEEEEEVAPILHPQGLRSRGSAILMEGEPTGEFTMAEGAERPEEVVERVEVEIPGVSTQPGASSA